MKRMFALLLALAMIFTLGACGSKKLDPKVLTDAMNDFAKDPSAKTFGTVLGGTLAGDEVTGYLKCMLDISGMSEDDLIGSLAGELEDTSYTQKEAKEIAEEDLAEYQEKLDDMVQDVKDQLKEIEDQKDLLDEDDYNSMHDALEALVKALDGAKIDGGFTVTIDNGEEEEDVCVFSVDGKWFSEALFEF